MKFKKRKYIGGCDTPNPINDINTESKHSIFPSLPIKANFDYTPNSANHLKTQGVFLYHDFFNEKIDAYKFKYLLKL